MNSLDFGCLMMITSLDELPCIKGSCVNTLDETKVYKVLLINPNSTRDMTLNDLMMVEKHLSPDCIVYGYTAPTSAPTTIGCFVDGVISAADIIRDGYSLIERVDACLVACFSDHPLTNCIREEFDIPVCGIMEAAIYTSRVLGGRFGILATLYRSQIKHFDAVRAYGLDGNCAGLLSTGLEAAELHNKPKDVVMQTMKDMALKLVLEKDSDVILLGCAGMADMQGVIEDAVKEYNVPVVDGVVTGVNFLVGIVRSDLKTSKRGLFSSSRDARLARGQDWL